MKQARSLKSRALQWLAQREQSRAELRRKLLAHSLAAESDADADAGARVTASASARASANVGAEIDALLDWLEVHRFLSDERFAESRVHTRSARFGNLRIRHELAQHAVALAPAAEQQLIDTELARARAVWSRKFPAPPATPSERARQVRFLGARGFSSEVIRRVLREVPQADDAGV